MYVENMPMHQTETIPIDEQANNEWEFVCYECSFRAKYTRSLNHGKNRLEVLDIGDPQARHTAHQGTANLRPQFDGGLARRVGANEEAWLTPELRKKLSEILQGLD